MSAIQMSNHDLYDMTRSLCSTFLGVDVAERAPVDTPPGARLLTACVLISGDWQGAVTVQVPESLARNVAAEMFAMDASEVSADEVQDALGEVANVLGGNVKALVPGLCHLSLPTVAEGQGHRLLMPGSKRLHQLVCETLGEPMWVEVIERSA